MKCPYCGKEDSKVIDSRPSDEGEKIRRRRECLSCFRRFTTYEIIETLPIMVVKKDKSREVFKREKLLSGILKACEKRPVPLKELEEVSHKIESNLNNNFEKEVASTLIGEYVMNELKSIDKVAYIRFASVYREFDDVDNFMNELKKLLTEDKK